MGLAFHERPGSSSFFSARSLSLASTMVGGGTMSKWDLEEPRREAAWVAETTSSELDDIGSKKTTGGKMTSTV